MIKEMDKTVTFKSNVSFHLKIRMQHLIIQMQIKKIYKYEIK